MNFQYRKLTDKDLVHFVALIKVFEDVFGLKNFKIPGPDYLQSLLEKDNIIIYVALLDNVVVAGLTAHILPSGYFESSEVYVYDLAVETAMQRKGIGKNLISLLKDYCAGLGYREIFVQADVADLHAIDFYKATGGIAESVIHFSYQLAYETEKAHEPGSLANYRTEH